MLDAILQATFLCALLLFWLCIYHGLRQNERKLLTFYVPKLIVIMPIWLCAVVLATWEKCNEMKDPTYSHFVDTGNYNVSIYAYARDRVRLDCVHRTRCYETVQAFQLSFRCFFPEV